MSWRYYSFVTCLSSSTARRDDSAISIVSQVAAETPVVSSIASVVAPASGAHMVWRRGQPVQTGCTPRGYDVPDTSTPCKG